MATHKLAIVPACMLAMGLTACGGGGGGGSTPNDPTFNLTVLSNSVLEGNSGTTDLQFTVKSDTAATSDIALNYAFTGGTATADDDYAAQSGTITIAQGSDQETLTIQVNGDTTVEADETIEITVTDPSNGKHVGTATITNDDQSMISIADATVAEGANGNVLQLTVTLDQPGVSDITVQYATSDGTAVAGNDYTASNGTLTIPAGETSAVIEVPLIDDVELELSETFDVTLSSPSANAALADASATATIDDNDDLHIPRVFIDDVSITEGDNGAKSLEFTVGMTVASAGEVTIEYTTRDGSATAGADYTAVSSGTVVIAAGETSKKVAVEILGDTDVEHNETFELVLGASTGDARVLDSVGIGTIENDDKSKISISDVSVGEGAGNAVLTITLDQAGVADVSVSASTTDGSASAGSDYTAISGETVIISAGQTSANVSVPLIDDNDLDAGESFNVVLSSPSDNAVIADGEGVATIVDNELPAISVSDAIANETDGSMSFTVSLNGAGEQDVTVSASTANGTAVAGDDYTAVSAQSVTIPAGQTSATVVVPVTDDGVVEADETFTLSLSGAQNATISDGSATGTISSEDLPVVSIADAAADEDAGTVSLTLSLDQPGVENVTVDVVTNDGSAKAGNDYDALGAGTTVTIPAGDSSGTVSVSLINDETAELDETFTVVMSNPQNATLGTATGTVTISDDDTPTLSVSPAQLTEGNDGQAQMTFTVNVMPIAPEDVEFDYSTSAGTATAGVAKAVEDVDYIETSGHAVISAGQTSITIDVPVNGDTTLEGDETLTMTLSSPSANALISVDAGSATGTILNDDSVSASSVDAQVDETDFDPLPLVFTVTLDAVADIPAKINWSLTPGTAQAGDDYVDASGTLSIPAGETTGEISVEIVAEEWVEDAETLTLNLAPFDDDVTIATPTVTGTINNDDKPALIVTSPAAITEGNSGDITPMTFTISLTEAADADITVDVDTNGGTATENVDFNDLNVLATIPAGQTSTTVDVEIRGDDIAEFQEGFTVVLSDQSANAEIKFDGGSTIGLIDNDDAPDLAIFDGAGYEGYASSNNTVNLLVGTSVPALGDTTVSYATSTEAGDNAIEGSDYTATSGTVTIPDGEQSVLIRVPVSGDSDLDVLAEKTFTVTLSAPSANAVLTDATGQGTIIDDDDVNVPSTGFTDCANATSNSLDCPVESHPVQDANVGRGSFSYTKLDANGADLAADATEWSCVRDEVTGLIWEVKTTDGGLHDKANAYPWFDSSLYDAQQPDVEPWAGTPGDNPDVSEIENTEEYVIAVNASNGGAGLCGATDWRMPTVDELYALTNLGARTAPAIDTTFFPNTEGAGYWTSTSFRYLVQQLQGAWIVAFDNGHTSPWHKIEGQHVRLVRDAD